MSPVIMETMGIDQLKGRLTTMAKRIGFPQPIFELIVEDMRRVERQVFSGQGRRYGGSWTFLQDETLMRKVDRGGSPLILIDTGALLGSLTEAGHEYADVHITDSMINFGTTRPGAKAQQFGYASHNIPARPFLNFDIADLRRWAEMLGGYFVMRV